MGYAMGGKVQLYYTRENLKDRGNISSTASVWRYPSDSVENAVFTLSNGAEPLYTTSYVSAQAVVQSKYENNLSFDYHLQRQINDGAGAYGSRGSMNGSLEYLANFRTASDGTMYGISLCFCPTSSTTILGMGGIIKNWTLTAGAGELEKCTVNMTFSTVTTLMEGTTLAKLEGVSAASNLNTTFETMNDATLTRTTWFDNGVANLSFTIDNTAEPLYMVGSKNPGVVFEGKQKISGSCDVFLNSSGTYEWEQIYNATEGRLTFTSGGGTATNDQSIIWTFYGVVFTEIPITSSVDTTALQSSLNWFADSVSITNKNTV